MRNIFAEAFVSSVEELFTKMLMEDVSSGEVTDTLGAGNSNEITSIIGLSGQVRGTVNLYLPTQTALAIVSRLLGIELHEDDESVADAVSEMANMVVGNAKARIPNDSSTPLELSLPTIVRGAGYHVEYPASVDRFVIPFESGLGSFRLLIALEHK
jgi:chemotaxis protein CheX